MVIAHAQTQPPARLEPTAGSVHQHAGRLEGVGLGELKDAPVDAVGVGSVGDAEEEVPGEDIVGVGDGLDAGEGGF